MNSLDALIYYVNSFFPFPYSVALYATMICFIFLVDISYKQNKHKIEMWKMSNYKLITAFIILLLMFSLISLLLFWLNVNFNVTDYTFLIALSVGIISSIVTLVSSRYFERRMPISHTVAIVGFPQSGKTTAIISIFGEIFARRILSVKATPRGVQTIERVNESLERLKKGRALGPTKDQDRFAFRTDITIKNWLFSRTYKVEFGDFPGEDSEEYSLKYGSWLHNTEYFKWVIDCDAIIFIIDLGRYLTKGDEYVVEISSALQAAWQHFSDLNEHRMKTIKNMPIVLVFTKADLFDVSTNPYHSRDSIKMEIMNLGFGDEVHPVNIDHEALHAGESQVRVDFKELIQYFDNESSRFRVLFISSYGYYEEERLGICDLLEAVLPKFSK